MPRHHILVFVKLKMGADLACGLSIPDAFGSSTGDHLTYLQATTPGGAQALPVCTEHPIVPVKNQAQVTTNWYKTSKRPTDR